MQDKYNPLESIATAIAFSPRDWSSHHRDAWIYGIVLGWDKEDLEELKNKHKWRDETVARLKFLHDKYKILKNKNEELDRYLKALDEIERHFECRCDICRDNYGLGADCSVCWHKDIKNIISKAKVIPT